MVRVSFPLLAPWKVRVPLLLAVMPIVIQMIVAIFSPNLGKVDMWFGGTSVLIMVSVALETTREIEAQMTMRHYKGFLE